MAVAGARVPLPKQTDAGTAPSPTVLTKKENSEIIMPDFAGRRREPALSQSGGARGSCASAAPAGAAVGDEQVRQAVMLTKQSKPAAE
jgi:hypothetical protein